MSFGMKREHKKRIRQNFIHLIKLSRVDPLLVNLRSRCVFSEDAIDSIRSLNGREKSRRLFLEIQDRGPTAFEQLIKALIDTNHYGLALLLDPGKEFIVEQQQICKTSGTEPFIVPAEYNIQEWHQKFPTYDISLREEPLQISVQHSENFNHEDVHNSIPVYYTKSKIRGLVKIINIYKFTRHHNVRKGSLNDVASLKELFEQMGLKVDVSVDLAADRIMSELEAFVQNVELKHADIAILVIMSHGGITKYNEEFFFDTCGDVILTSYVEGLFSNDNCRYMQRKPKMIIFQTCRGLIKDKGVNPVETDGCPLEKIPTASDLLIIHSTLKETQSHRDIFVGAWFIQLLCDVFMNNSHNTHVEDMLKLIQNAVQLQRSGENTMQTAEYINRSFNLCYFNPGIYIENGKICHF